HLAHQLFLDLTAQQQQHPGVHLRHQAGTGTIVIWPPPVRAASTAARSCCGTRIWAIILCDPANSEVFSSTAAISTPSTRSSGGNIAEVTPDSGSGCATQRSTRSPGARVPARAAFTGTVTV